MNRFKRDEEREADVVAVRYAYAAGFKPEAALTALEQLQEAKPMSPLETFIDSHPAYPDRLRLIRRTIEEVKAGSPALNAPRPARTTK